MLLRYNKILIADHSGNLFPNYMSKFLNFKQHILIEKKPEVIAGVSILGNSQSMTIGLACISFFALHKKIASWAKDPDIFSPNFGHVEMS